MKTKTLVVFTAIVAAVVIPFSSFAATANSSSDKSDKKEKVTLTEQQKTDMEEFSTKLAALQKEYIAKMVANGLMTQEQADTAIERIDEMLESGKSFGLSGIMGMGNEGSDRGEGRGGSGFLGGIDLSELTDEQKSALTEATEDIAALQEQFIEEMVSEGLLTEEQGSAALKRIEASSGDTASSDKKGSGMRILGGLNLVGMENIDTSKLTDAQKELLISFYTKLADIQEDLISAMVSNGAITSEQGETCIENIDNMLKSIEKNGFTAQKDMRKGSDEGRRNNAPGGGKSNSNSSAE